MALGNCKECGKEISSEAASCPHCGRPQKKKMSVGNVVAWILVVIAVLYFIGSRAPDGASNSASTSNASRPASAAAAPVAAPPPAVPPLEVQSWHCEKENSYMYVRGEVKNVSSDKLENVAAVGTWRTERGDLVKSDDALLQFNPIMPGQVSPFETISTGNPQARTCVLAFQVLGGGQIDFVVKKKDDKPGS